MCKLKKSLYGLKQSQRALFDRFIQAVCDMRYSQCNGDHTVFYKHQGSRITILVVYVDDIVITGDDMEEIKKLKERLGKAFEVKDLDHFDIFLGLRLQDRQEGLFSPKGSIPLICWRIQKCLDVVHVVRPLIRITKCVLSQVTQ